MKKPGRAGDSLWPKSFPALPSTGRPDPVYAGQDSDDLMCRRLDPCGGEMSSDILPSERAERCSGCGTANFMLVLGMSRVDCLKAGSRGAVDCSGEGRGEWP